MDNRIQQIVDHHAKKTALVLFTRSAHDEAREKDLTREHNLHAGELIAKELISHAECIARKSGLPYIIIGPTQQSGNTFGQKLKNAFESAFSSGFENVIAIGNDCPELTASDLTDAALQLQTYNAVAGPDAHGGVYLIGIHTNYFHAIDFEMLPWKSSDLAIALVRSLKNAGASVYIQTVKSDIDTYADMLLVLQKNRTTFSLKYRLLSILASFAEWRRAIQNIPVTRTQYKFSSLRAPPVW